MNDDDDYILTSAEEQTEALKEIARRLVDLVMAVRELTKVIKGFERDTIML